MAPSDQERFAALLDQHRKIVFKVAGMYCRDPEDRRDLAQEIRAQLWRAFPRYDATRRFSTWMYRVVLNVAISHARGVMRRGRHAAPLDIDPVDLAAARALDERLCDVHRLIGALEPMSRALLLLHLEEHSHREIGEVLGITEANVATRLSRLWRRLRAGAEEKNDGRERAEEPVA
jgi:RNA polymerase sigma-70 factor (ECF subfamily)